MKALRVLSLTARLALIFALFAAGVLLVAGLFIERAVKTHFDELDEHDLSVQMSVVGNLLAHTVSDAQLETLPARLNDLFAAHGMVALVVREAGGQLVHAIRPEVFAAQHVADGVAMAKWSLADGRRFVGQLRRFELPLDPPRTVEAAVALDVSHHAHFLDAVRLRLWLGMALVALAAAALAWVAARRGLAPLRRVTATAHGLSADRLDERLSGDDAPAEMRELVEAFNGMLDRLQAAFRRLDAYSADIAHELRTPVSNLMTATQVALSRARSADEYRETLHSNLEEFERLARMTADMLFLAKADEGRLPRAAEPVALAHEAAALAEFYEALAEERGVAIRVSGAATVTGDRLMLRRALSNLLSNALRHARAGTVVGIVITEDAREARVEVSNQGEEIPPERIGQLFERFHRLEGERARHGEGAGLGLAITHSIAVVHGGRIEVASAAGQTRFTLCLPHALASQAVHELP